MKNNNNGVVSVIGVCVSTSNAILYTLERVVELNNVCTYFILKIGDYSKSTYHAEWTEC